MRHLPFHRHILAHRAAYLTLLCLSAVAALTLFRLTAPPDDTPRLLLIRGDAPPPEMDFSAAIDFAAEDAPPELRQMYVLATGSGGYDAFCAPVALLDDLYAEGLIQPLPETSPDGQPLPLSDALTASDGTPVALPLTSNHAYALCLAHHAGADALLRLWPGE